jgi:hypothetical protein
MPDNRRLVVCAPLPEELLTACEQGEIWRETLLKSVHLIADDNEEEKTS